MPLKWRAKLPEDGNIFSFAESSEGETEGRLRALCPSDQIILVPLGLIRILWIVIRQFEIKSRGNVHDRKCATGMS
jgi:hypothetical protein